MRGLQRKIAQIGQISRNVEALKAALGGQVGSLSSISDQNAGPMQRQMNTEVVSSSSFQERQSRPLYGVLTAVAGLAVLGAAQERMSSSVAYADTSSKPLPKEPDTAVEDDAKYRRVRQKRGLPKEILLYQYEVCPFCNKVRAFLDYHNVPYRVVEVNPLTKKQIKWSEYKKVPVVMLDDEVVNDSSLILSRMACEFEESSEPQKSAGWFSRAKEVASTSTTDDEDEEIKWRKWVDKTFVQLITVNIYRTAKESWQTFDYITSHGNFNFFERQAARLSGSGLMYAISGRLIKKYGIQGDLRQALYGAASDWVHALGDKPFKGGEKPDLSDLSMFGVIRSVTGTDTFMDLMHLTPISGWYERMMAEVGSSSRLPDTA